MRAIEIFVAGAVAGWMAAEFLQWLDDAIEYRTRAAVADELRDRDAAAAGAAK